MVGDRAWGAGLGAERCFMGFLAKFFGRGDPTRKWVALAGLNLHFDFSQHALCGVQVGEDLDLLQRLGPAEDGRAARLGSYRYYSKGFEVCSDGNVVESYVLVWRDDLAEGYKPFVGDCKLGGTDISLSAETTEEDIVEIFGSPYWRSQDADEVLLFYEGGYEHGEMEWQVELTPQGKLKRMTILSPPLLASEEQRRRYEVTKPWPPRPEEKGF